MSALKLIGNNAEVRSILDKTASVHGNRWCFSLISFHGELYNHLPKISNFLLKKVDICHILIAKYCTIRIVMLECLVLVQFCIKKQINTYSFYSFICQRPFLFGL